jgi:hypothetical protein
MLCRVDIKRHRLLATCRCGCARGQAVGEISLPGFENPHRAMKLQCSVDDDLLRSKQDV